VHECTPSVTGFCSRFTATGDITGDGLVSVDTFPNADGLSKAAPSSTSA
jgi:hypothetical protein